MENLLLSINFKLLKVFIIVSECKRIDLAAKNINLSPSSVSKQISKLEAILNFKLFLRKHGEHLELTREGHEFLMLSISMMSNFQSFYSKTKFITNSITVNIGINVSSILMFNKEIFPFLMESKLKFKIQQNSSIEIVNQLKTNKIDIGIHCINIKDTDKIYSKYYSSDELALYVHREHPLSHFDSIFFSEVLNYKLATFEEDSFIYNLLNDEANIANKTLDVLIHSADFYSIYLAIEGNLAIGVLPRRSLEIDSHKVKEIILKDNWAKKRDFYISISENGIMNKNIYNLYNKIGSLS